MRRKPGAFQGTDLSNEIRRYDDVGGYSLQPIDPQIDGEFFAAGGIGPGCGRPFPKDWQRDVPLWVAGRRIFRAADCESGPTTRHEPRPLMSVDREHRRGVPALTFNSPIKLNTSLKLQRDLLALRCATTARRQTAVAASRGRGRSLARVKATRTSSQTTGSAHVKHCAVTQGAIDQPMNENGRTLS